MIMSLFNANLFRRAAQRQFYRRYASQQSTAGSTSDPYTYCRNLVKQHDHESWLCSYFYPQHAKPGYFALKAFFLELAMIPDTVSNQTIGQMRLQFWRDAVSAMSGPKSSPPKHPIAIALSDAVKTYGILPYHLKRVVDARGSEIQNPTHITMATFASHAEATHSTLLYMLLQLLSSSSSSELNHAASHLGLSHTIMTLLRGLPFHASKGRLIIPAEITSKHSVRQEDVFRHGSSAKGIEDAVYEFATIGNDNLIIAQETLSSHQERYRAFPVFLTGATIHSFLSRLEQADFNVFDPSLQHRHWKLPWQIWRANANSIF